MAEEATQDRDLNPDSEEENPIDTPEEAEANLEEPVVEEKE
jgi:hypothetical protein